MEIKKYEEDLIAELETVVNEIITETPKLDIAVKKGERVGDAISKFFEDNFVAKTQNHAHFSNSEASPSGKTKNPWDARTDYTIQGFKQDVWIDFKAVNVENDDTNPDSGTPDKIIAHILNNNFYLVFIYVFYQGSGNGLEFVQVDGKYVKPYFLKDISSTFRITPANQMQVNGSAEPEYRTREEFLQLLLTKKVESNERKLKKSTQELENLKAGLFKKTKTMEIKLSDLSANNKAQEDAINNLK
ncbi:conserved hypothetical protein [Tenacibaculum dicentrarchi]|uniref:Restriction endonuclease n=1 Tax=Tenacibaculum dicentrarchi TaxID=669041 RepID=A0ABP1ENI2_9FLAO|nr:conserved hypothetical protein [Tenacibaculum dicentrarchi]